MGKYYFCSAETKEKPCNFKCGSTMRWDDHMEFEHNIVDAKCPSERELLPIEKEIEDKRNQMLMETYGESIKVIAEQLCNNSRNCPQQMNPFGMTDCIAARLVMTLWQIQFFLELADFLSKIWFCKMLKSKEYLYTPKIWISVPIAANGIVHDGDTSVLCSCIGTHTRYCSVWS